MNDVAESLAFLFGRAIKDKIPMSNVMRDDYCAKHEFNLSTKH
jgi:hypothetical protein